MSHNVPAVYDVLPARIRALRSKGQGWQNVGGGRRGNEAQRNDLAERNPEGALAPEAYTVLLGAVQIAYVFIIY
jgi:hypothetical protein